MKTPLFTLALLGSVISAQPQTFNLDWWTLDGGGDTSSGGGYSVSGTIGQPDAGVMSGGSFSLVGGFWAGASTSEPTEVPRLSVEQTAPNCVRIFWPSSAQGFVLQATPRLNSTPWASITAAIVETNGCKQFLMAPSNGNHFYRLKYQP